VSSASTRVKYRGPERVQSTEESTESEYRGDYRGPESTGLSTEEWSHKGVWTSTYTHRVEYRGMESQGGMDEYIITHTRSGQAVGSTHFMSLKNKAYAHTHTYARNTQPYTSHHTVR
jgi:hypothetical protein